MKIRKRVSVVAVAIGVSAALATGVGTAGAETTEDSEQTRTESSSSEREESGPRDEVAGETPARETENTKAPNATEPQPEAATEPQPEAAPEPQPEAAPEPQLEPAPEPGPVLEPQPAAEPEPQPVEPEPTPEPALPTFENADEPRNRPSERDADEPEATEQQSAAPAAPPSAPAPTVTPEPTAASAIADEYGESSTPAALPLQPTASMAPAADPTPTPVEDPTGTTIASLIALTGVSPLNSDGPSAPSPAAAAAAWVARRESELAANEGILAASTAAVGETNEFDIRLGTFPSITPTPDGSKLIVAAGEANGAGKYIAVVDAASGTVSQPVFVVGTTSSTFISDNSGTALVVLPSDKPTTTGVFLDTATGETRTITFTNTTDGNILLTPDGSRAIIATREAVPDSDARQSVITVYDTATGNVLSTSQVAGGDVGKSALRLSEDGGRAVFVGMSADLSTHATTIDTETGATVSQASAAGTFTGQAVISDDGSTIAFATRNGARTHVVAVDTETSAMTTATMAADATLGKMDVSHDGKYVVTTGRLSNYSSEWVLIDTEKQTWTKHWIDGEQFTAAGGAATGDVQISGDGTRTVVTTKAWDSNASASVTNITTIDNATGERTSVHVAGKPTGSVAVSPDGSRAVVTSTNYQYWADTGGTYISVVDLASGAVTSTTHVDGGRPWDTIFSADGSTAVIVTEADDHETDAWLVHATAVDIATGSATTAVLPGQADPRGASIDVSDDGSRVVIATRDRWGTTDVNHVSIIDTSTGEVLWQTTDDDADRVEVAITSDGIAVTAISAFGPDRIVVQATDLGLSTNTAPQFVGTNVLSTDEATGAVIGQILAGDADGDLVTYRGGSVSAAGGSVVINENGTFVYTPTPQTRFAAGAVGASGNDSFEVTIDDGKGGITTTVVDVAVSPTDSLVVSASKSDSSRATITSADGSTIVFVSGIETGPGARYYEIRSVNYETGRTSVSQLTHDVPKVYVSDDGGTVMAVGSASADVTPVTFINTTTGEMVTTNVGGDYWGRMVGPTGLVYFSGDGGTAVFTGTDVETGNDVLVVIDSATGDARTVTAPVGMATRHLSDDGRYLTYVSATTLTSVDLTSGEVVNSFTAPGPALSAQVKSRDDAVYITTYDPASDTTQVSVFNLNTLQTETIGFAGQTTFLADISKDGRTLAYSNDVTFGDESNDSAVFVDLDKGTAQRVLLDDPRQISLSADSSTAWVKIKGTARDYAVVDVASGEVIRTLELPSGLNTLQLSANGKTAVLRDPSEGGRYVIVDAESGAVSEPAQVWGPTTINADGSTVRTIEPVIRPEGRVVMVAEIETATGERTYWSSDVIPHYGPNGWKHYAFSDDGNTMYLVAIDREAGVDTLSLTRVGLGSEETPLVV